MIDKELLTRKVLLITEDLRALAEYLRRLAAGVGL